MTTDQLIKQGRDACYKILAALASAEAKAEAKRMKVTDN